MRTEQARVLETLDRVKSFLDANESATRGVVTRSALDQLAAARDAVVEQMMAQGNHHREVRDAVTATRRLRLEVANHLRMIVLAARLDDSTRWHLSWFRAPYPNGAIDELVTAAYKLAEVVDPCASTLRDVGLPADFIGQLRAAAVALQRSATATSEATARRADATAGLKSATRAARSALRLLDAFLRHAFVDDDFLLEQWKEVSQTKRPSAPSSAGVEAASGDRPVGGPCS